MYVDSGSQCLLPERFTSSHVAPILFFFVDAVDTTNDFTAYFLLMLEYYIIYIPFISCLLPVTRDSSVGRAVDCRRSPMSTHKSIGHWFDSGSRDFSIFLLFLPKSHMKNEVDVTIPVSTQISNV